MILTVFGIGQSITLGDLIALGRFRPKTIPSAAITETDCIKDLKNGKVKY
jgi:hypothetical protein